MSKNMHKDDFDKGTKIKLAILELNFQAWLATVLSIENANNIVVYDFFAGTGTDRSGEPGSPVIFSRLIMEQCNKIKEKGRSISILFNDKMKSKNKILKMNISILIEKCKNDNKCNQTCPFSIRYSGCDFLDLFHSEYKSLITSKNTFHFMFLDQYGFKYVDEKIFKMLCRLNHADILFFTASDHIKRFQSTGELNTYLQIKNFNFTGYRYNDCHRAICDFYRTLIPEGRDFYLSPFSIKKPDTGKIFGLIFACSNLLALHKFLEATWKIDPSTGEANYDLYDEKRDPSQKELFPTRKEDSFFNSLLDYLSIPRTNIDIYKFSLLNGFLPKTANALLMNENTYERLHITPINGVKIQRHRLYLGNKQPVVEIWYERN